MTAFALRVRKNPYFLLGLMSLGLVLVGYAINFRSYLPIEVSHFSWQVFTGTTLFAILAFQWGLFLHQVTKNFSAIPQHRTLHKYSGILFLVLFAFHADSTGYIWMTVLTLVLAALVVTGLFNREILAYRKTWIHRVWLWLHIAFAAAAMPLVLLHVMVALAFE